VNVESFADAGAFLAEAGLLLLADEARHNLILGIAANLRDHPGLYEKHGLRLVRDGSHSVGAALRTPPFNLVLALPEQLCDVLFRHGRCLTPAVSVADGAAALRRRAQKSFCSFIAAPMSPLILSLPVM
jgi:hypothetical protein